MKRKDGTQSQRCSSVVPPRELVFLRAAQSGGGNVVPAPPGAFSQPCLPVTNIGPTKILPHLYLGSYQDSLNEPELKELGINFILNVSRGTAQPDWVPDENFHRVPVDDNYDEKLTPYFTEAFDFIDKARQSNGAVLVHCMAGISRSAAISIGYFMREHACSSEEALRFVKERRPTIAPNFNFLGQLLELERTIQSDRMRRHSLIKKLESGVNSESLVSLSTSEKSPISLSSRSLSLADEPHAPKRSKKEARSEWCKSRPTGLSLGLPAPSLDQSPDVDIDVLVQTSLNVRTPETQFKPFPGEHLYSIANKENSPSPIEEDPPRDFPVSNIRPRILESQTSVDDSVFKKPQDPFSPTTPPRLPSSAKRKSPIGARKAESSGKMFELGRPPRKPLAPQKIPIPISDRPSFALFPTLTPVEDCSPDSGSTGTMALDLTPGYRFTSGEAPTQSSTTFPGGSRRSPPDSSSTSDSGSSRNSSSSNSSRTRKGALPTASTSRQTPKTKLLFAEHLKVMLRRQRKKNVLSMSDGMLESPDTPEAAAKIAVAAYERGRPNSFCLPTEYLERWDEIMATAAQLPHRSLSCNMLETRRTRGVEFERTSSGGSFSSLSRPSSSEAVAVGGS